MGSWDDFAKHCSSAGIARYMTLADTGNADIVLIALRNVGPNDSFMGYFFQEIQTSHITKRC